VPEKAGLFSANAGDVCIKL